MFNVSGGEVSVDSRGNSSALLKHNYRTRVENSNYCRNTLLKSVRTTNQCWVRLWGLYNFVSVVISDLTGVKTTSAESTLAH